MNMADKNVRLSDEICSGNPANLEAMQKNQLYISGSRNYFVLIPLKCAIMSLTHQNQIRLKQVSRNDGTFFR
jgi:hypothetical protein